MRREPDRHEAGRPERVEDPGQRRQRVLARRGGAGRSSPAGPARRRPSRCRRRSGRRSTRRCRPSGSTSQSTVYGKPAAAAAARTVAFWAPSGGRKSGLVVVPVAAAIAPSARLSWSTIAERVRPVRSGTLHVASPTVSRSGWAAARDRTDFVAASASADWPVANKRGGHPMVDEPLDDRQARPARPADDVERQDDHVRLARAVGDEKARAVGRRRLRRTEADRRLAASARPPGDASGALFDLDPGNDRQLPADLDPVRVVLRALRVEARIAVAGSSRRCSGRSS